MRSTAYLLSLFILLSLCGIAFAGSVDGEFDVTLRLEDAEGTGHSVKASILFVVNVPKGIDSIVIPFPLDKTQNFKSSIQPTGDDNTVLLGHVRPDNKYIFVEIIKQTDDSKVVIKIEDAEFPIEINNGQSLTGIIKLPLYRAYDELKKRLPSALSPKLNKLIIESKSFKESTPPASTTDDQMRRQITLDNYDYTKKPITIFIEARESKVGLYFLIIGAGLIGGILTSVVIEISKTKAKFIFVTSLALLFVSILVVLFVVKPQQVFYDTTTVVIVSSSMGLIIGLLIASSIKLFAPARYSSASG